MANPNQYMYEGRWMDLKSYRIKRGLAKPLTPSKKPILSTQSVLDEKKALDTSKKKEALKKQLKEANEDIEEYTEVIEEKTGVNEIKKYEGEKPIADMTYFEMIETLKDLGHSFQKSPNKKEAYALLTK